MDDILAIGTLWGWLEGVAMPLLVLWWFIRHIIYLALGWVAMEAGGKVGVLTVTIIFLVVHPYKAYRFMNKNKNKKAHPMSVVPEGSSQEGVEKDQPKAWPS